MPEPAINNSRPAPDLLARLTASAADLAARRKPAITRGVPELYAGRWFVEVWHRNSLTPWFLFSGLTAHEAESKATTRIKELA
jgi:hypothetical protein